MSTRARLTLVLAWVLAECLHLRSPVWPPVPCRPGICLLASAVPHPPELELRLPELPRQADACRRLLHREETPNLERLNHGVDATLSGVTEELTQRKMRNGTIMSCEPAAPAKARA